MAELQYSFGRAQLGLNLSNSVAGNENRSLSSATPHLLHHTCYNTLATTHLRTLGYAAENSPTIQTHDSDSGIPRQYYKVYYV